MLCSAIRRTYRNEDSQRYIKSLVGEICGRLLVFNEAIG
jgi:hypothetical protein